MSSARNRGGEALAEALAYVEAGYALAPVTIRLGTDGKKRPTFHTSWQYPEPGEVAWSRDPDQVVQWSVDHPGCGFHAPCGPNGIVVVDADVSERNDGPAAWRAALGPRSAMTVRTQSGGRHLHFRAPAEPIRNSSKAIAGVPGVDVRGEGGTVFTSGTHVHGGGDYVAERIVPVGELPELSDQWAAKLRAAGPSGPTRDRTRTRATAPSGPRVVKASSVHGREWIEARVDDELRELRRGPGNFRARLFAAAAIAYRAVGCGVLDQIEAEDRLAEAVRVVWGHEPDRDDARWIAEAQDEAVRDPWRVAPEERETPAPGPERPQDALEGAGEGEDDDEDEDELTPEQRAEARYERELAEETRRERLRREAARRLAAEDAPELRVLDVDAFLDSPEPEALVPGLLYRDSLARVFGAPGSGKSFVAIDVALSVALGRQWGGRDVAQGPVFYVMAEGQAVNVVRAKAWLERHGVDRAELRGRFFTVPDAVMLTEEAARPFVEAVRERGAALVILDTKNAMMVGEESSATDFAVLRRVLDQIRKASGACVVLVDHTGYEGTRARGTSAGTAAMDTEARVENDGESPAGVTVSVTRDKAAEAGASWSFFLRMAGEAAVLVAAEGGERPAREDRFTPAWQVAEGVVVPSELLDYDGKGAKALPDLARFMAHDASPRHGDVGEVGVTRAEAVRALKAMHEETSVRRAWSVLLGKGFIDTAEGVKSETGRHVWTT